MKITAIKTHKVIPYKESILDIIKQHVSRVPEKSIVVITSKIISVCEGNLVSIEKSEKETLIKKEAQLYLDAAENKYHYHLSIKHGILTSAAGIDESNGSGYHILWPKNPTKSANKIVAFLKKTYHIKEVGVIITDSRSLPLRKGASGVALGYSGFAPLKNYINTPDIFGRYLRITKANHADALAAAAVFSMGEGDEQTPLALIENIPSVKFHNNNPTKKELNEFTVRMDDDVYWPILKRARWIKGKGR